MSLFLFPFNMTFHKDIKTKEKGRLKEKEIERTKAEQVVLKRKKKKIPPTQTKKTDDERTSVCERKSLGRKE